MPRGTNFILMVSMKGVRDLFNTVSEEHHAFSLLMEERENT